MDLSTKVHIKKERKQERENSIGQMDLLLKGISMKTTLKEWVLTNGVMERNIQENGKLIGDMDKEYFNGQMGGNTLGNLRMTKKVE